MGMFRVDMEVSPMAGGESVTLSALVDTGATFSMAPKSTLERAGLAPTDHDSRSKSRTAASFCGPFVTQGLPLAIAAASPPPSSAKTLSRACWE